MKYEHLAVPHYNDDFRKRIGSLREVKTFFLATVGDVEKSIFSQPNRNPALSLLKDIVEKINKSIDDIHYAYYTIIPPGGKIYPHRDTAGYYQKINRYQVFFDLTADQIIVQEGNTAKSNSLILFDTFKTHGFYNISSTDPWRFVVFDIYKSKDKNI